MDIRVKERLIGAILLVAVIVALVPELLTGPRRAADSLPSGDGSLRTYTVDLGKFQTPSGDSAPQADSGSSENAPATAREAEAEMPETTPEPVPKAPDVSAGETLRPTSKPASSAAPQAASAAASLDSGWAVQLGSFANRENAERLAAELKDRGFRAFVSRFESGRLVRYRVRVGPEQERSRAEALARRLQRDGRQVSVVAHP